MDGRIAMITSTQLGLITRRQLLDLGLTSQAISKRVGRGRLVTLHPGVYVLAGVPRTWDQTLLAALFAAGRGAAVSFLSAGAVWRMEDIRSTRPELTIAHERRVALPGIKIRRTRVLDADDFVPQGLLIVTSPARTLIDLAGILTEARLEDVVDDALRRRLLVLRTLDARIVRLGDRRLPGIGRLKRIVEARTPVTISGSSLENRLRRVLKRARLPIPSAQFVISDGDGRFVARVDFAFPEHRLAIEVDGYQNHSGRRRWESDLARQNALVNAGWRFLRFPRTVIDGQPERVVDAILRGLRRPGEQNAT